MNKISKLPLRLLLLSSLLGLAACNSGSGGANDTELRSLIAQHGLSGNPAAGRALPSITSPLPQLGMKLFYTKSLGGDFDSACVSCHHPALGGGDDLPHSIGVTADEPDLLGPGRTHDSGFTVPRNAPTTFNIALWDSFLFHDGRIESLSKTDGQNGAGDSGIRTPDSNFGVHDPDSGSTLVEAQVRFPVTSDAEMRGHSFVAAGSNEAVRSALADRLSRLGKWSDEFARVFGDNSISYERIQKAIAAYERSQVFVESPWKAYVEGDDTALSSTEKYGAVLFFRSVSDGGAGCVNCHSGDFFTDEQHYAIAVPQIGPGKGDGEDGTDDFGRMRETGRLIDKYAFRTPSLLNVEVTGPYGHTGAFETLREVIEHHLDPATSIAQYPFDALDSQIATQSSRENSQRALETVLNAQAEGTSLLPEVELSDSEINSLVDFLRSLTDPCVKSRECLSPWIPDNTVKDLDGRRLDAVGPDGKAL